MNNTGESTSAMPRSSSEVTWYRPRKYPSAIAATHDRQPPPKTPERSTSNGPRSFSSQPSLQHSRQPRSADLIRQRRSLGASCEDPLQAQPIFAPARYPSSCHPSPPLTDRGGFNHLVGTGRRELS